MLTVQGSESIAAVEKYLEQLSSSPSNANLKLPTRLRDDKLGGKAALMQLIVAWGRRNRTARLTTHIQNLGDAETQIGNLLDEDHGLLALIMAPSAVTLRGASVGEALSRRLNETYKQIYQKPRLKGPRAFFLIADHRTDAAIDSFYDHLCVPDEMRAERKHSFIKEVNNFITECIQRARGVLLTSEQRKSAGEIIYELFSNTERWAQHDISGKPLEPRARAILVNVHTDAVAFRRSAEGSVPLERYLDAVLPSLGKRPTFLEVSVVDSGVGLAQRKFEQAITKSVPINSERQLVIDCSLEHGTSSSDETEGIGLHHTLKLLTARKGFMRYRGGRLSLFRDFAEHPYLPEKHQSRAARMTQRSTAIDTPLRRRLAFLIDWVSGELEPTQMANTEGALFTLLIPLDPLPEKPAQLDLLKPE